MPNLACLVLRCVDLLQIPNCQSACSRLTDLTKCFGCFVLLEILLMGLIMQSNFVFGIIANHLKPYKERKDGLYFHLLTSSLKILIG